MSNPDRIKTLRIKPEELDALSPREFEELVAELLASFGWEVSLTPETRDGGHDILAISRDASGFETVWAVECKYYAQSHAVGVDILRSLYGVKEALKIQQGLLVTTSRLTKDAQAFATKVNGVKIADRSLLLRWISGYKTQSLGKPHMESRRFRSCFISHSHQDEEFVTFFVERLRNAGVRCWFAPEDITPGRKIHEEIKDAIQQFDRLIIVLSESSMKSEWVKTEISHARQREAREGSQVLFPISLVPFATIKQWECFDADTGKDSAREIREYFVPDFSNWKEAAAFDQEFTKLLRGLNL